MSDIGMDSDVNYQNTSDIRLTVFSPTCFSHDIGITDFDIGYIADIRIYVYATYENNNIQM